MVKTEKSNQFLNNGTAHNPYEDDSKVTLLSKNRNSDYVDLVCSSEHSTKEQIHSNKEEINCEKSDDTLDSGTDVYRSTTVLVDSGICEDVTKRVSWMDCCGCWRVRRCYRHLKDSVSDFSPRQWRTLTMLCLGTLTSSLSVCLFPPFFPKLAESKGETATIYGMVIGTNCLTAFIVTPIVGKNLERIGVNFAFVVGTLCSGAFCVLSGFLEYFGPGWSFFFISIAIRVLHATANAGIITSTIAFIANEFPKSVAFLFSMTRATMNFAQMFGPVVGGALHNIGGFKMPFFVLGSMQILTSVVCGMFLPKFKGMSQDKCQSDKKASWSILKIPGLWISFLTFIFSTMSNGFLSITLEPRVLRKFNISPLFVGVLFGLKDGANCLASPIWGGLCDRFTSVKIFIVIGSIMGGLSFVLLGPFPGLPLEPTLTIVVAALVINGIGVGGQQVAGFVSATRDAVLEGYPDNAETHAFIAGLWSSLSGAGRFVSRTGSGILVDNIGFRNTSAIVTCLNGIVFLMTSVFVCFSKKELLKEACPEDEISTDSVNPSEPRKMSELSELEGLAIPVIRDDIEDSFMIGSASSRASRRNSRLSFVAESLKGRERGGSILEAPKV